MSYCRFENTLRDLEDCMEAMRYNMGELSNREANAFATLVECCREVTEMWEGHTHSQLEIVATLNSEDEDI